MITLPGGVLPAKSIADWNRMMQVFPNIAGTNEQVDQRAVAWVNGACLAHAQANADNWRVASDLINIFEQGRMAASMPKGSRIHVPALYRAFEAVVLRVIDVIAGTPEWFKPYVGRDNNDEQQANRIAQWHQFLHEQGGLLDTVEPLVRNLFIYKCAMLWTSWQISADEVYERETERIPNKDGFEDQRISLTSSERITYMGTCYEVVDGSDQILDHGPRTVDKMRWVGRRSWVDDETVREMERSGQWKNTAAAVGKRGSIALMLPNTFVSGSTPLPQPQGTRLNDAPVVTAGVPDMNEQIELCGLWAKDEGGSVDEWIVTLVNQTVVGLRKNFFPNKERPAQVETYSREGRRLIGVGPLEQAIPLQAYLDQIYACVLRNYQNSVAPPTVAKGMGMALPYSMWEMDIGRIFNVADNDTASLDPVRFPNAMGDGLALMRTVLTQIEEITGAPRFWEGSDTTGTATEIDTRQIESNKRLTYPSKTIARLLRRVLRFEGALSRRFATEGLGYRVLGSGAVEAVGIGEFRSEDFGAPIDYVIPGPEQLDMYGLRATRITAWVSTFFPMLQAAGSLGDIDFKKISEKGAELMIGPQFARQIFPPDDSALAMPPEQENSMIMWGEQVPTRSVDDHQKHKQTHIRGREKAHTPTQRANFDRHIALHDAEINKQRAEQAQMEQRASRSVMMPDRLAPQEGRSGRSGGGPAPYQRPMDTLPTVTSQTPPGEIPGPGRASQFGASDRSTAIPQGSNRA